MQPKWKIKTSVILYVDIIFSKILAFNRSTWLSSGEQELWAWYQQVCVLSCFSCAWLFVTPWTVAHQAPLSMGFSGQEYWSGLPFPSPRDLLNPGNLPDPGIQPCLSPALAGEFFTNGATWESHRLASGLMHLKKKEQDGVYFFAHSHSEWRCLSTVS